MIKSGFLLRNIAGQWVVVPVGERSVEFTSIMTLTETGADIWNAIVKGDTEEEILQKIVNDYDVTLELASADYKEFIDELTKNGIYE